jgi:hypothetical protein
MKGNHRAGSSPVLHLHFFGLFMLDLCVLVNSLCSLRFAARVKTCELGRAQKHVKALGAPSRGAPTRNGDEDVISTDDVDGHEDTSSNNGDGKDQHSPITPTAPVALTPRGTVSARGMPPPLRREQTIATTSSSGSSSHHTLTTSASTSSIPHSRRTTSNVPAGALSAGGLRAAR